MTMILIDHWARGASGALGAFAFDAGRASERLPESWGIWRRAAPVDEHGLPADDALPARPKAPVEKRCLAIPGMPGIA